MTHTKVREMAIRYVCKAGNDQPERADRVERSRRILDRFKIHMAKREKAVVWNLYAHRLRNGQFDRIIMPDKCGKLDSPAPKSDGWYAVKWPVNPHFTGESGILEMLNQSWNNAAKSRESLAAAGI
jgi:hypothetical protein